MASPIRSSFDHAVAPNQNYPSGEHLQTGLAQQIQRQETSLGAAKNSAREAKEEESLWVGVDTEHPDVEEIGIAEADLCTRKISARHFLVGQGGRARKGVPLDSRCKSRFLDNPAAVRAALDKPFVKAKARGVKNLFFVGFDVWADPRLLRQRFGWGPPPGVTIVDVLDIIRGIKGVTKGYKIEEAVAAYPSITLKLPFHNACHDAIYTLKLFFAKLDELFSLKGKTTPVGLPGSAPAPVVPAPAPAPAPTDSASTPTSAVPATTTSTTSNSTSSLSCTAGAAGAAIPSSVSAAVAPTPASSAPAPVGPVPGPVAPGPAAAARPILAPLPVDPAHISQQAACDLTPSDPDPASAPSLSAASAPPPPASSTAGATTPAALPSLDAPVSAAFPSVSTTTAAPPSPAPSIQSVALAPSAAPIPPTLKRKASGDKLAGGLAKQAKLDVEGTEEKDVDSVSTPEDTSKT